MEYFVDLRSSPNISKPFGSWSAFDRTRILFNLQNVKEIAPIGTPHCTDSFKNLCDRRAEELVSVADGRKIYVLWSGGIDSTLVLAALRKVADHKQLTVIYSPESIKEYPWLFDEWVNNKLETVQFFNRGVDASLLLECIKDGIICTGEIADQVFGSMIYGYYKHPEMLLKNWRYAGHFTNPEFVDRLEQFVLACPQKINTVKDFLWWYNYAVKYQGVCFRMLINTPGVIVDKNMFHFFHTKEFNDWAVTTPTEEKFYGTDLRQYKMVAKDYIYKETKDSEYKTNKVKEPSSGFGDVLSIAPYKKICVNWGWHL